MAGVDEPMDVSGLGTRQVLQLYAAILDELVRRGVVRSRNAPAGDLAETLTARAYGGVLAPKSEKSWDVRAGDGRRLQVKCRVVDQRGRAQFFSPFRSWEFDACLFIQLDAHSYEVRRAIEVPVDGVRSVVKETRWVAGFRATVGEDFLGLGGACDVTDRFRAELESIDGAAAVRSHPAKQEVVERADVSKPTGICLCGCGAATAPGKFFVASHDRRAESQVIKEHYGDIAGFVLAHRRR